MSPMKKALLMGRICKLAYAVLLSGVLMLQTGCRVHRPDDIMSPKMMEKVLYDYHLAQAVISYLPSERHFERDAYLNWVYEHNDVSKEYFDESLVWYTRHPKELYKVYQRLNARIDVDWKAAQNAVSAASGKSAVTESGDSVDLWYLDRTMLLNTSAFMDRVTFTVPEDTTFHRSDTVRWDASLRFTSLSDSVPQTAYLAMSVYYTDSIWTCDTLMRESGPVSLTLVLDSIRPFKLIRGSINYIDTSDTRDAILAVYGNRLERRHRIRVLKSEPEPAPEL